MRNIKFIVQSILRLLALWSRRILEPVFKIQASSNKLFLYFRQISQTFVDALSSFIFDVAIDENFDGLLTGLREVELFGSATDDIHFSPSLSISKDANIVISDVDTLTVHHSRVLDNILHACLLGPGQETMQDMLRACLQILVQFGMLVINVKRGRMNEVDASTDLEDLFRRFRAKVLVLVSNHVWNMRHRFKYLYTDESPQRSDCRRIAILYYNHDLG